MLNIGVPDALQPLLKTARSNQPITLYGGSVLLTDRVGRSAYSQATLRLRWLPSPRIELDASEVPLLFGMGQGRREESGRTAYAPDFSGSMTAKVPSVPHDVPALITQMGSTFRALVTQPVETGPLEGFKHVLFHVPNFLSYYGQWIGSRNPARPSVWAGRTTWKCAGWNVTLDSVEGLERIDRKLKQGRGFAITHVGRLERADGTLFGAAQTNEALEKLSFLLSFVRGAWTSCTCPVAFGDSGEPRWARWDAPRVSATSGSSWFSYLSPASIGSIAEGFFERAAQAHWWDAITLSLNWYFEANEHPGMIHSAVVLQQNALETLAWTIFVEGGPLSDVGFDAMPAADRIRLMLSRANIPLGIPPTLPHLTKVGKQRKWKDGPHALTDLRNAIVHPKKRKAVGESLGRELVGAWKLGQWYLELVLLWLFRYAGEYQNRLDPMPMVGRVERVPWAEQGHSGNAPRPTPGHPV